MTIYLVGGPARCGKSTLVRRLPDLGTWRINQDHLVPALRYAAGSNRRRFDVSPGLTEYSTEEWLRQIRSRDEQLWDVTGRYLLRAAADADVLAEGPFWPDMVARWIPDSVAVFLLDTSDAADQAQRLYATARADDPDNWMIGWSEAKIETWAGHNRARSVLMKQLAEKHHFDVFDAVNGFDASLDAAEIRLRQHARKRAGERASPDRHPRRASLRHPRYH